MTMKIPEPIKIAQDALFELDLFVKLAWGGSGYAQTATRLKESIRRAKTVLGDQKELGDTPLHGESEQDIKKLERFANEQANQGFPYLYEIATVRLWMILETAANDFTLFLLEDFPKVLETDIVQNLKGPLVTFLQSSQRERAVLLLEGIKREVNSFLHPGVGRFEAVFKALNFGGPVPDIARRQLLELSETRHVIVHRNSNIDTKFIERCPWFGLQVGEKIRLNHKQHYCHWIAVACYLSELLRRCVATGLSDPGCADPMDRIREFEELRDDIEAKLVQCEVKFRTF